MKEQAVGKTTWGKRTWGSESKVLNRYLIEGLVTRLLWWSHGLELGSRELFTALWVLAEESSYIYRTLSVKVGASTRSVAYYPRTKLCISHPKWLVTLGMDGVVWLFAVIEAWCVFPRQCAPRYPMLKEDRSEVVQSIHFMPTSA